MVTLADARSTIYTHFVTEWADETPYTFDNETFDPPENDPWVRLSVRHTASSLEAKGGRFGGGVNQYMREGSVIVQVFTPRNGGLKTADDLAEIVREMFEGRSLAANAIRFNDVTVREVGVDGSWFQLNVDCEFNYSERK